MKAVLILLSLFVVLVFGNKEIRSDGVAKVNAPGFIPKEVFSFQLEDIGTTNTANCGDFAAVLTYMFEGYHRLYVFKREFNDWVLWQDIPYFVNGGTDKFANSHKQLIHGQVALSQECHYLVFGVTGIGGNYRKIYKLDENLKYSLRREIDNTNSYLGWSVAVSEFNSDRHMVYFGWPDRDNHAGRVVMYASTDNGFNWEFLKEKFFPKISTISFGTDISQNCGASLGVLRDKVIVGCPNKDKYTDTSFFSYHQSDCVGAASDSCKGTPSGSVYHKHKCTHLGCSPVCLILFTIRNECKLWNPRGGIQNVGSLQMFDSTMDNLEHEEYGSEQTNFHLGFNLVCSKTECFSTTNGLYSNIESRVWDTFLGIGNVWVSVPRGIITTESFNSIVSPWSSFDSNGDELYGALYPRFHGTNFAGSFEYYEFHNGIQDYTKVSGFPVDTTTHDITTRAFYTFYGGNVIQRSRSGEWNNDFYAYTLGRTDICYPFCQPKFIVYDTGYLKDVRTPAPTGSPTGRPTANPTQNFWTKIEEIDMSSPADSVAKQPIVKLSGDAHNLFYGDPTLSRSSGQVFEFLRDKGSPYNFGSSTPRLVGSDGVMVGTFEVGIKYEINRYGNAAVTGLKRGSNGYIHSVIRGDSWFSSDPITSVPAISDAYTTIPVISAKGDVSCGVSASRIDLVVNCYTVDSLVKAVPRGSQFIINPTQDIVSDEVSAVLNEDGTELLIGIPGPESLFLYHFDGTDWDFKMGQSSLAIPELSGQETDYGRKVFALPDFSRIVVVSKKGLVIYSDRSVDFQYSTVRFQEIQNIFVDSTNTIVASADLERIYTVSYEGSHREFNPSLFTTTTSDLPQIVSQLNRVGTGPNPNDYTHVQEKRIQNVFSLDTTDNGGILAVACLDCLSGNKNGVITFNVDVVITPPPTSPPSEINATWPEIPKVIVPTSTYFQTRDQILGTKPFAAMNKAGTCIATIAPSANSFIHVFDIDVSYTITQRGAQFNDDLDPLDPANGISISEDCNRILVSRETGFLIYNFNSITTSWDFESGAELADQLDNTTVKLSNDGKYYVSRDVNYKLKLVEVGSATSLGTPISLEEKFEPGGYSTDKKSIVAVSHDNRKIATVAYPSPSQTHFPYFSSIVAIYEFSDILNDWADYFPTLLTPDYGSTNVIDIQFSPDGTHFAVLWDHEVEVYKIFDDLVGAIKIFSDSDGNTHTLSDLAISNKYVAYSDVVSGEKYIFDYKNPGEFMQRVTDGVNALSADSSLWLVQESNGGAKLELLGPLLTATDRPTLSPTFPQPTTFPTTSAPTASPTPLPTFKPETYIRVNEGLVDLPFGKQCAFYKDSRVSQGMAMSQKYNGLFLHHYLDYDGSVNFVTSNPHKRSSWSEDLSENPSEVGGSNPARVSWGSKVNSIEECQNRCSGAERCIGVVFSTDTLKCGLLQQCVTGLSLVTGHDSYLRTSFNDTLFDSVIPGKVCLSNTIGDPTRLSNQLPPTPKQCFDHCKLIGATHFSLDQSLFCSCYDDCSLQVDNDFAVSYALLPSDTVTPTISPTNSPTETGETASPTGRPTARPTRSPQELQLKSPTGSPTIPTSLPTKSPTNRPTNNPTLRPTNTPAPTEAPKETIIWNLTLIELIGIISAIIALIGIGVAIWSSKNQNGPIFIRKPSGGVRFTSISPEESFE